MNCPKCKGPLCKSDRGMFCYACQELLTTFSNVPQVKQLVLPAMPPISPLEAISEGSKRRSKYNAIRCEYKGLKFDSKKELADWQTLELREAAGEIKGLTHHEKFYFTLEGETICYYEADASYWEKDNPNYVVQDSKSDPTRKNSTYRLKKRLMKVFFKIDIREV